MNKNDQHADEDKELTLAAVENYESAEDTIESGDYINAQEVDWDNVTSEDEDMVISHETHMFDIDRMVNEGLGGGEVTADNGFIGASTTDTMVPESQGAARGEQTDPEEG